MSTSQADTEIRRRIHERDDRAVSRENDHRVLSFRQWCQLNAFSVATGRRIVASGVGPTVIQLSERRVGITVAENRRWQASRVRNVAPTS